MVHRNINGASQYHKSVIGLNGELLAQGKGENSTLERFIF
jgi:hypothetical protein